MQVFLTIFLLLIFSAPGPAAADENEQNLKPAERQKEQAENEESKSSQERSIQEILQSLTVIENVIDRRDPFEKFVPKFMMVAAPARKDDGNKIVTANIPELERLPANSYKVQAVLLGDVYPRALVKTPQNNTYIVKKGDKIGNRSGVVGRIDEGGLVVVEKVRNQYNEFSTIETLIEIDSSGESVNR